MRLKLEFYSNRKIALSKNYNSIFQAIIYTLLDRISGQWLHENGFELNKRKFKLFCFSDILQKGKYLKDREEFLFPGKIGFLISSPIDWILEQVAKNIAMKEELRIGSNITYISSIEIFKREEILENRIRINALTPIEVHSKATLGNGKRLTHYYSPDEKDFSNFIIDNMRKKWLLVNKEESCPYQISIKPVRKEFCKQNIRYFKGTVIKGYKGHYWLEGDRELLSLALDTGLGTSNSAGFGMIEVVRQRQGEN